MVVTKPNEETEAIEEPEEAAEDIVRASFGQLIDTNPAVQTLDLKACFESHRPTQWLL